MAAVAELEASLQYLQTCKPPGVTKSRITSITTLCVENVKSESVLVQKIFTHFKRTLVTHKLGVLYVVDSVTRQWIEKAVISGQDISSPTIVDGTFVAGVRRMTEILPAMMTDICLLAPDDQKEKIVKMIDIWERGNIFPAAILIAAREKLHSRPPKATPIIPSVTTTQIIASQPVQSLQSLSQRPPAADAQKSNYNSNATNAANGQNPAAQNTTNYMQNQLTGLNGHIQITSQNLPAAILPSLGSLPSAQADLLKDIVPADVLNNPESLMQYLQLLQRLVELGVPADQWTSVIAALHEQVSGQSKATSGFPPNTVQSLSQAAQPYNLPVSYTQPSQQSMSIPTGLSTSQTLSIPQIQPTNQSVPTALAPAPSRERSRSPPRRRRDSPVYGEYRSRSPLRSGSPSLRADKLSLTTPKWTDVDVTLPNGSIKVLSRTLFIGGVSCTEEELRRIFDRFGTVQTCIVNSEKRHAFVKMVNREDAVAAKNGMELETSSTILSKIRSTRWGVGFGPRDCSNYQTGESIIPIDRLTEADVKWVLSAEYGGTGGLPIKTGIVMEEPDIEIGAGVSSKAISRRVTQPGPSKPQARKDNSTRTSNAGSRRQKQEVTQAPVKYHQPAPPQQYDSNALVVPPAVPGFGFQFASSVPPPTQYHHQQAAYTKFG